MDLANKFKLPVLSFVDTAGAYPGRGAEERGQAEAIARSIQACLRLKTLLFQQLWVRAVQAGRLRWPQATVW